jgi:hypothetical protein
VATAAQRRRRQRGGSVGSMVAASAKQRRQCSSKAVTAGSAATALAVQDGSGRDKDNGRDSNGRVHSQQSNKRGSGRDDSGNDGDGGGNSDSNGKGDGDSEDKDSNANVKEFFGCTTSQKCRRTHLGVHKLLTERIFLLITYNVCENHTNIRIKKLFYLAMTHCQAVALLLIANSGLVTSLLQQGSIIARSAFLAHAVP